MLIEKITYHVSKDEGQGDFVIRDSNRLLSGFAQQMQKYPDVWSVDVSLQDDMKITNYKVVLYDKAIENSAENALDAFNRALRLKLLVRQWEKSARH